MKEAIVIGCGVSGLTCGILLQEAGYSVTILARDLPPFTTSNIAAAVWYPYKAYPIERVLKWSQISFEKFCALMHVPDSGVSMITLVEIHQSPAPDPWWKDAVHQFRHHLADELPGYTFDVPLIETPIYMNYLVRRFQEHGGKIEQRTVENLEAIESPFIINCAGLGARELVKDASLYPIRGQIVRTTVPSDSRGWLEESDDEFPVYIFPRSQDCIVGGTAQENNSSLQPDTETAERILEKATALVPELKNAQILEHLVGLRPGRPMVRLEREILPDGRIVIHNYGHGGAGFTLSWGCAGEVLNLITG